MAFVPKQPSLGYPPIAGFVLTAGTDYVKPVAHGTIITAEDPTYGAGEFIFLKGLDTTGVGTWVVYNSDDFSTTLLPANGIGPVAVAMAATLTGYSGWYQIQGKAVGKALTGFLDNANVYATSTAGSVDDSIVAGDRIQNAKGASAVDTPSAGLAEFEIARPWINDALAD